jgi:hypothetical protein
MLKGGVPATWTAIHLVAPRDPGGSTTGYLVSLDTISVRAMTIMVVAVAMTITEVAVADAVTWIATPQVAPGADGFTARQLLAPWRRD